MLWRTIYLSKLPRFPKKVRVALDWTLDLLFRKDLTQFLTRRGSGEEQTMKNTGRLEPSRVEGKRGTATSAHP
jgi:hypothetical protein